MLLDKTPTIYYSFYMSSRVRYINVSNSSCHKQDVFLYSISLHYYVSNNTPTVSPDATSSTEVTRSLLALEAYHVIMYSLLLNVTCIHVCRSKCNTKLA